MGHLALRVLGFAACLVCLAQSVRAAPQLVESGNGYRLFKEVTLEADAKYVCSGCGCQVGPGSPRCPRCGAVLLPPVVRNDAQHTVVRMWAEITTRDVQVLEALQKHPVFAVWTEAGKVLREVLDEKRNIISAMTDVSQLVKMLKGERSQALPGILLHRIIALLDQDALWGVIKTKTLEGRSVPDDLRSEAVARLDSPERLEELVFKTPVAGSPVLSVFLLSKDADADTATLTDPRLQAFRRLCSTYREKQREDLVLRALGDKDPSLRFLAINARTLDQESLTNLLKKEKDVDVALEVIRQIKDEAVATEFVLKSPLLKPHRSDYAGTQIWHVSMAVAEVCARTQDPKKQESIMAVYCTYLGFQEALIRQANLYFRKEKYLPEARMRSVLVAVALMPSPRNLNWRPGGQKPARESPASQLTALRELCAWGAVGRMTPQNVLEAVQRIAREAAEPQVREEAAKKLVELAKKSR